MIIDLHGTLTYSNRSYFAMFGHRNESEILGKPLAWLSPCGAEGAQTMQKIWNQILSTGFWNGEVKCCRTDRTSIDIHLSSNIIRDATGAPLCVIMDFTEVSQVKRRETESSLNQQKP